MLIVELKYKNDLIKINNQIKELTQKNKITLADTYQVDIKKGEKLYFYEYDVISKTKVKELASKYEFIIVDNPNDADTIVFPTRVKSRKMFDLYDVIYDKANNRYVHSYSVYSSEEDKKFKIESNYKSIDENLLIKAIDKKVMITLYFSNIHFGLNNSKKEDLTEYNDEMLLEMLKSSSVDSGKIAVQVLRNKNIDSILFELLLLFYSVKLDFSIKLLLKQYIFDKIPYLYKIHIHNFTTINDVLKLKKDLNEMNIPTDDDIFINLVRDDFFSRSYYAIYGKKADKIVMIDELSFIINSMKLINIELTNQQIISLYS